MSRLAIIGGGPSGLLLLKRLRDYGLDAQLFEATDELGGVWAQGSSKLYPTLHANTPRAWMHFADKEFAQGEDYPHHSAITSHLLDWVAESGIRRFCKLNAPVKRVSENADGSFSIEVAGEQHTFDRLCLCSGKTNEANIPSIPVADGVFAFHSSELGAHDEAAFAGKHVVICGFGQASAVDVCELASKHAASVTVVTEAPIFLFPRRDAAGGTPVGVTLVPPAAKEQSLRNKLRKYPTEATDEFVLGRHYISVCWQLDELIEAGKVTVRLGSLQEVRTGDVRAGVAVLEGGEELPADVVIFGTGYKSKVFDLLDEPLRATALAAAPLYDAMWVPGLGDRLAVMGQQFGFFWLLELQAQWVAMVWAGRAALPPAPQMQACIDDVRTRREVAQAGKTRKKVWALPEHPIESGVRLAMYTGGWPGEAWVKERAAQPLEPRQLYPPFHRRSSPAAPSPETASQAPTRAASPTVQESQPAKAVGLRVEAEGALRAVEHVEAEAPGVESYV